MATYMLAAQAEAGLMHTRWVGTRKGLFVVRQSKAGWHI